MLLVFSLIFGALLKIYDELIDNKISINKYLFILIQLCIIILGVLICNTDSLCLVYVFFLSVMYLLNIIFKFLLENPIDTYFYIISTFIIISLFIRNINKIKFEHIIINIIILILTIIESFVFSEEYSIAKLIYNFNELIFFTFFLCFNIYTNNIFINATGIAIGYVLTWVIFKQYIVNKYINIIDIYSFIWKKLKKIYKKLKSKKMIVRLYNK